MDRDEIKAIFDSLVSFKIINISQIPDIDLYMDQVLTFVEDRLGVYKRKEEDKILTKTMINNYTKEGLISPPVKKKYSREHIVRLIMLYHLKNVLSIGDIGVVLNSVSGEDCLGVYDNFVRLQENERQNAYDLMREKFDDLSLDDEEKRQAVVMAVFALTLEANCRKQLAEKLIDKLKEKSDE